MILFEEKFYRRYNLSKFNANFAKHSVYNRSLPILNQRQLFFSVVSHVHDISRTSKYSVLTSSTRTDEFRQR